MRPSELFEAVKSAVAKMLGKTGDDKVSLFVWGAPGIGKSQIVRQIAKALKIGFIDLRAALLDPVDLRGLPTIDPQTGRARWAQPDFLPTEGEGILFLDELPQATPLVQAALLQLVLDGKLGEYSLPAGWVIIAAGNRAQDRAGGHRMISSLSNRFLHLDQEVSNEDWQDWARDAGIALEIRGYLRQFPTALHDHKPELNERAFASPRSWEFVSRILPTTTDTTIHPMVAGCVGEGHAAKFVAFARVFRALPDLDGIIAAPTTATVPTAADVLWAVTVGLAERVRIDADKAAAATTYASRIPKEFGVMLFRDVVKLAPQVLRTAEGKAYLQANRDALIAD